jgi:uncharacterized protein (TIGR00251 family)
MRLEIKVIPGSSKELIKQEGGLTKVYIHAQPVDGKANQALIKLLAKHYHVSPSSIEVIRGEKSRLKIVEIH